jgi:hypothetical protein
MSMSTRRMPSEQGRALLATGFFGDFGAVAPSSNDSDLGYEYESAEERSSNTVHIQMCESCIDSIDDIIVDFDNAIVDGMPVNDKDSPMLFEDYREPLVTSSKAILQDVEDILQSAQAKNFEKLALAASSCVSSLVIMKEAAINACSTLPLEKQPQLLSPVKSIAMKAQDQIYSGMLVLGMMKSALAPILFAKKL